VPSELQIFCIPLEGSRFNFSRPIWNDCGDRSILSLHWQLSANVGSSVTLVLLPLWQVYLVSIRYVPEGALIMFMPLDCREGLREQERT
jgi:hypothetical protein